MEWDKSMPNVGRVTASQHGRQVPRYETLICSLISSGASRGLWGECPDNCVIYVWTFVSLDK